MNHLLTLTFIVMKLTDTTDVSWWWILPVLSLEGILDEIIYNYRRKKI